jgi:ComF family protein
MPDHPLIHASLKRGALRLVRAFKNAVFPLRCQICGKYFHPQLTDNGQLQGDTQQRILDGQIDRPVSIDPPPRDIDQMLRARYESLLSPHVCGGCLGGFAPIRHPYCSMCGIVFKSRSDTEHLCGDCIKRPKAFDQARAVALYAPGFMELLQQLKYRGKIQLAGPLGRLLLTAFMSYWPKDHFDLVMPVPLHKKKMRQRGFNQALLLIDKWGRFAERSYGCRFELPVDRTTLVRTKPTASQTGLGRTARRQNIKNAFKVTAPWEIDAKRILLVDDVYTTGATVGECAWVLMKAGAQRVDVLTLARAV